MSLAEVLEKATRAKTQRKIKISATEGTEYTEKKSIQITRNLTAALIDALQGTMNVNTNSIDANLVLTWYRFCLLCELCALCGFGLDLLGAFASLREKF